MFEQTVQTPIARCKQDKLLSTTKIISFGGAKVAREFVIISRSECSTTVKTDKRERFFLVVRSFRPKKSYNRLFRSKIL
jgi:hypothetical protein